MSFPALAEGSIARMLSGNEFGHPIVQVLGLSYVKHKDGADCCNVRISDGKHYIWLYPKLNPLVTPGELAVLAIIKLTNYGVTINNNKYSLASLKFKILHTGKDVGKIIGSPREITQSDIDDAKRNGGILSVVSGIVANSSTLTAAPLAAGQTQKRLQSQDTPEGTVAKRSCTRNENVAAVKPIESSSAAVQSRVVVICSVHFPLTPLTTDQMECVSLAIMEKIIQNKDGDVKPQFTELIHKDGYLSLSCKNDLTRDWLIKNVPTLVPWTGAKIHAVDEELMPHSKRAVAFIPNGAKHDTPWIMAALKEQNHNFNFESWFFVKRIVLQPNAMMVWVIDQKSADLLKSNKNELFFGFGTISVDFKTADHTKDAHATLYMDMKKLETTKKVR